MYEYIMVNSRTLNFKKHWQYLIGSNEDFSLEARIFHCVSVIVIFSLIILTGYNFLTTLQFAAFISIVICIIQAVLYYISRFKTKLTLATTLSAVAINICMGATYFYNSGITGSVMLLFALTLFLIILVIPRRQRLFWYILNLVLVTVVVLEEYFQPNVIQQHYANRGEMFLDISFTYLVVVTLLYISTVQIRLNYDEQKQIAEEKADKLELLNQQKDKLFSIISHDLTGPLASLKQYLSLLTDIELTAHERRVVETDLTKSLGDAQYLLENLLQWTKSQMEHNRMNLELLSLRQLIGQTIKMFDQVAASKNIKLIVNIDEHLILNADRNMFQAVVRNLLNNAIKFTYAKGKVELKSWVEDDYCIISVRDNGTGISEEKQAKLFTMNIASSYGTELEKGTGLGLMLCKDFTEKQGGKIWFESLPDSGTTFYVAMPLST
ncbi:MAG: HAMP domain-containing histidine kinase [Pedobacter sp.]|nr:MAG: HAMP domain-containing histidine kinase [Pedobacter sp.]